MNLAGRRIFITGGPTRAYLDAVRYISNHSSGALAASMVGSALAEGADVLYARGAGAAAPLVPPGMAHRLRVVDVETVEDLVALVEQELPRGNWDAFIHAMAVLDFAPAVPGMGKTPSRGGAWNVELLPTPKVIKRVKALAPGIFLVAFKLEAGRTASGLIDVARQAMEQNKADLMVANLLEDMRDGEHTGYLLVPGGGEPEIVRGKAALGERVVELVARGLGESPGGSMEDLALSTDDENGPVEVLATDAAARAAARADDTADILAGRQVIVAVTGGIACYKAAGLVSRLRQAGAQVSVLMTPGATRFVAPLTFRALANGPVLADLFEPGAELAHVRLADAAEAVVVAPASADFLARLAAGMADDIVTATLLALRQRAPVIIAPAMNVHMWENPLVQDNVARLEALGYHFVGPDDGFLAEGYEGTGRLADEGAVLEALARALTP